MKKYHIGLDKDDLEGARVALLPGDPGRCEAVAGAIARLYGAQARELAFNREFCTFITYAGGSPVLVTSTGIGGPSTSIAIEELAQLGIRKFIRVGTTGAVQGEIEIGDVVIATGAVRLDGAGAHYAPIEFPAVSDFAVASALSSAADEIGVKAHMGIVASSDTFYPGESRKGSYREYVIHKMRGRVEEWKALGVLSVDMETATVLAMTASMGLSGGSIMGVVNRAGGIDISGEDLEAGQENMIAVAARALSFLKVA